MNKEVQNLLNSDLLYKYLIGVATTQETTEVEYYILKYPEVKQAYETLENDLEIKAKFDAVKAPDYILNNTLLNINEPKVIALHHTKRKPWYAIAASVVAFIFGAISLCLYIDNTQLKNENNIIVEEIFDLRNDIQTNNSILNQISGQLEQLNNPDSKKYVISGNKYAKDLKTVAYINPIEKTTLIDVVSLPKISEDQYYQIRAELHDRMVSLGILKDTERHLKPIPYLEDALALSITIETKGNSANTDKSIEVGEITIR